MDATNRSDPVESITFNPNASVVDHAELLERAQLGDRRAVDLLVTRFRPLVERTARRYTRSAADADDVVQDVWLTFVSRLETIHSPARLPGWLTSVTVRAAIKLGRSRATFVPLDSVPEAGQAHVDEVVDRLATAEARTVVRTALDRLPPSDSDLLRRLFAEERPSYTAVSAAVERPVGSLGPTRRRLLQRLERDPAIARLAAR